MPARRSRVRVLGRVVLAAAIVVGAVLVAAVAGLPLYVFPATDDTEGVDAVMVLGPPAPARFATAERVSAQNGGVPIVISAPATGVDSVGVLSLCREDGFVCRTPEPFTTAGEALIVRELAAENGWEHVAVVTTTPHIARSRFLFDRCAATDIRMVSSGVPPEGLDWWAAQYTYQTAAFVKALFTPC